MVHISRYRTIIKNEFFLEEVVPDPSVDVGLLPEIELPAQHES